MRQPTDTWITCSAKCHGYLATDYSWHKSKFNFTPKKKVYAVEDGVVTFSGMTTGDCGNLIEYIGQKKRAYGNCHLSKRSVVEGQKIKEGEVIGIMGHTGLPTKNGVHLHLRMTVNGKPVDPDKTITEVINMSCKDDIKKQKTRADYYKNKARDQQKRAEYYKNKSRGQSSLIESLQVKLQELLDKIKGVKK